MSKSPKIRRNLSFVSIGKPGSKTYATNTHEHEKVERLVVDIEALRAISRIVRTIKERIDAEATADRGKCAAGGQGPTATRTNCGQNNYSESRKDR